MRSTRNLAKRLRVPYHVCHPIYVRRRRPTIK
jgi:hypothetical protein